MDLKFFDGFSYERIAEVMSLNVQSVRNLIFNALQAVRKAMPCRWPCCICCAANKKQVGGSSGQGALRLP
ncbi:RNA polymerase sigma factor [Hymenobacter elongatus]|uniref:RNA polymerase sigma factor 70 region 4 type 2 domain-containing protein n=1 Tax=Hymenobacter elongatus TaxID=877208 RepID=A0A4Z0PK50_9BACT|nr:hypothetical protein E5J99_12015 [Hymenobacter elongatus]